MGVERIRLSPPRLGLGPESERASPEVTARRRLALGARPSPAVRQHPGKLARRLQGEAAAGAWGVATPGELRGCAGCEPGARATDVAWAGAAPALAKRGARFGAPSARLPEVPSASPSRDRDRGLPSAAGGRASGDLFLARWWRSCWIQAQSVRGARGPGRSPRLPRVQPAGRGTSLSRKGLSERRGLRAGGRGPGRAGALPSTRSRPRAAAALPPASPPRRVSQIRQRPARPPGREIGRASCRESV